MNELLENCVSVEKDPAGSLILIRPNAKYILVNQDEKIHHSNDVQRRLISYIVNFFFNFHRLSQVVG